MISFTSEAAVLVLLMTARVYSQDCGDVTLTDNSGTFTSPNYPKDHGHSRYCKWTIHAEEGNFVELRFPELDLNNMFMTCEHDYVTVDNGTARIRYCDMRSPPEVIKSEANEIVVTFESDAFFMNGKGFKAVYEIVDKNGLPLDKQNEETEDYELDADIRSTTVMSRSGTSTGLLSAISKISTISKTTTSRESPTHDAGKMSGFVIGAIVVLVGLVFCTVCGIAFVRYRRNKDKRISLNVIATPDDKELINGGKIYKRVENSPQADPEAQNFPL